MFSVKGTKEVAYAVFNALTDPENGSFRRVRSSGSDMPNTAEATFSGGVGQATAAENDSASLPGIEDSGGGL